MPHGPIVVVHGGAGRFADERLADAISGCREAARVGWQVLAGGASALDAATAAVAALEDDPTFNAGYGSVLNRYGQVEMDASLMDGARALAGAVAAVRGVRNPIHLARHILEDGRHVLLAAEGARQFASQAGMALVDDDALVTPRQRARWEEAHGTVGCVAMDREGRLAAATSTGGIFDKLRGRVGDSALIGCGTFASGQCAVSCTGHGEAIIRAVLARTAAELWHQGGGAEAAADAAVRRLAELTGGEGGLIMLDTHGQMGFHHNARHMPVAWVRGGGETGEIV